MGEYLHTKVTSNLTEVGTMEGEDQAHAQDFFRTELNLLLTGLHCFKSQKGTVLAAVLSVLCQNLLLC
jgi:hypothetical protein